MEDDVDQAIIGLANYIEKSERDFPPKRSARLHGRLKLSRGDEARSV